MALADLAGRRVLVLNAGSSSLKASLIELPQQTLGRSETSWGVDASRADDREAGVRSALDSLAVGADGPALGAVGHRIVHGGARFTRPTVVDDEVLEGIEAVADLAPLHNRVALDTIRAARRMLPDIPHVACFDTAFHSTLPPAAFRYPVPERWYESWGVRRYGFHGLSVEWSSRRAASLLDRPSDQLGLVVAHLGSGCSVTAVAGGRSVDTSMGMTPLEGLMMGTRSGSIDPGVPFRLVLGGTATPDAVVDELEHASGLLGVSGRTSDMRELEGAAADGDERATLAIDLFVRRAAAGIAAIATSLDRLDAIVFTGGIGEHAGTVRRRIVARLGSIGVAALPASADEPAGDALLSSAGAAVAVLRVEAREDLVIATGTGEALATG